MKIDEYAGTVLAGINSDREFRHEMLKWARRRDAEASGSFKTRICPCCKSGIDIRALPATDETLLYCCSCGWWHKLNRCIDEARQFGERMGKRRGEIVAQVGWTGRTR